MSMCIGHVDFLPRFRVRDSVADRYPIAGPLTYHFQRLPTEAIGNTIVTFSGIVVGTEIHVYLPDGTGGAAGTELAGVESCVANQQLSWPVYANGNSYNSVHITLVKRGLGWRKFRYTSVAGSQTLPIFQNADLGYNNPA